jgi:predicted ATPase/class 3 adenylate cyclase
VQAPAPVTTFLFTDIEGSTQLWDAQPARMRDALARHDAFARTTIGDHRGTLVKSTGDGVHAVFGDPLDALLAAVELQRGMLAVGAGELALSVRAGLHAGVVEQRDDDYFGSAVNRAARIMSVAHGGQILVSQVVADLTVDRLPHEITLASLGAVRLRGLASPETVHQVVHPALRRAFPPPPSLEATPNNLPQPTTSFVGRARDADELASMLRKSRLVTVVGAGGLGKTRLSLHVAAQVLDDFPDGAWLVELAPLTDPTLVAQAVASVLDVKEEPGRSIADALAAHVSRRTLLLVLDNCEHLLGACAELASRLLQSAPHLAILASSRERLNIRGEATYTLAPLVVPDAAAQASLETLAQSDAVRLFIDRASAVQPAFRLTEQNAAHVVEICSRLDGIPLAIELAAARTRAVPMDVIAARLDDRFRLLASGDRAALPRQQTLRALIDWSYDLLSEPERTLFRRLSVFRGGFTLEAGETVTSDDALDRADVLDLLAHLVEKSLVVLDANGERYDMLETVREYAAARLDSAAEANVTRDRHLRYFVALVETAVPDFFGPAQGRARARIVSERENILAAHAFCASARDGVELNQRLVAMKFYWINRGLPGLGFRLGAEALARTRADDRSVLRCHALADTGLLACYMGRYAEGRAYLEESLAIARALANPERIAGALQPLALACLGEDDVAAARGHLEEALELARGEGDWHQLAAALNAMAQLHRTQDELPAALPLYEQVLKLARDAGDRETTAIALLNLAMATAGASIDDRVPAMLREALDIASEIGSKPVAQSVLEVSAGLAASRGDWPRAARLFGAAEGRAARTGLHRDPADEAFLAPLIARARHALGEAAFAAAERAGRAVGHDDAISEVRAWLRNENADCTRASSPPQRPITAERSTDRS